MSLSVATPKENRIIVAVLNGSTATTIPSGSIVKLSTASAPNAYKVEVMGATAGTVTRTFGVVEHAIATGETGACVIFGPANCLANGAITVKSSVIAQHGTAGVRGRGIAATIATAGGATSTKYAGYAMSVGATGSFFSLFVNPVPTPVA